MIDRRLISESLPPERRDQKATAKSPAMGWCTLRFRSIDQISTACTIAGVMMYSLKKPNSEFANSQEILFLEKWPVAVGKRGYR